MGLWVGRPRLMRGEQVRWRVACNWKQGQRVCGGFLWLTTTSLVFEPNRFDVVTGGERRRVALKDIRAFSVEEGGAPSLSGGLRPRIRIELRDGGQELLLVNKMESRLVALNAALAATEYRRVSALGAMPGSPACA